MLPDTPSLETESPGAAHIPPAWLLLIHNIPPKPGYLRAKAARKLATLGAVALKNAVYVLPEGGTRLDDLTWLAKEIEDGGGRAFVCRATFAVGMDDAQLRAQFVAASDQEYERLAADMRTHLEGIAQDAPGKAGHAEAVALLARFHKEFEAVRGLDFFGAPGREAVEGQLAALRALTLSPGTEGDEAAPRGILDLRGRTWVTRRGVHVDRVASAWLIRRFIDPEARFLFVDEKRYAHRPGEVRFDMFSGEFTHEGDLCTFEVLVRRLGAEDPALRTLAEMIHDIDLREELYGHPESAGLRAALEALALTVPDDEGRVDKGGVLLDLMYESFRTRQTR